MILSSILYKNLYILETHNNTHPIAKYKIGLVGVTLSYYLNLKVLLRLIRSPEIADFKAQTKKAFEIDVAVQKQ